MIRDNDLILSDAQAITVDATSTAVDLGVAGTPEYPVRLVISVDTTFTAAGAATLDIALRTDSVEAMSSPTKLLEIPQLAVASMVAGLVIFDGPLPRGAEQWLDLNYDVSTGPFTAGKINASLVLSSST